MLLLQEEAGSTSTRWRVDVRLIATLKTTHLPHSLILLFASHFLSHTLSTGESQSNQAQRIGGHSLVWHHLSAHPLFSIFCAHPFLTLFKNNATHSLGESQFNQAQRIGGDSGLTARGEEYARLLPDVLESRLPAVSCVFVATFRCFFFEGEGCGGKKTLARSTQWADVWLSECCFSGHMEVACRHWLLGAVSCVHLRVFTPPAPRVVCIRCLIVALVCWCG